MKRASVLIGLTLMTLLLPLARAAQPAKMTVRVGGADCDGCVTAIRAALARVPGIKFNSADVRPGERPKFFSSPFLVELADPGKTDLGAVAKAAAEANTPHKGEIPPRLYLVLFGEVDEATVVGLRQALADVPGVDTGVGGVGGFPQERTFWVRLDPKGQASVSDIRKAIADAGIRVASEKQ
jgi:copper chaperone CopZ